VSGSKRKWGRRAMVSVGLIAVVVTGALLLFFRGSPSIPSPLRIPLGFTTIGSIDQLSPGFWRFVEHHVGVFTIPSFTTRIILVAPPSHEVIFDVDGVHALMSLDGDLVSDYSLNKVVPRRKQDALVDEANRLTAALEPLCQRMSGPDGSQRPFQRCGDLTDPGGRLESTSIFRCPEELTGAAPATTEAPTSEVWLTLRCTAIEAELWVSSESYWPMAKRIEAMHRFSAHMSRLRGGKN